jgi:hypothetical protein
MHWPDVICNTLPGEDFDGVMPESRTRVTLGLARFVNAVADCLYPFTQLEGLWRACNENGEIMRVLARLAFGEIEEALSDDLCDSCRALVLAVREYNKQFLTDECVGEPTCHVSVAEDRGQVQLQCDPRP